MIREGVDPNILLELEQVYRYGALRKVNATNTKENLLQYFLYKNHESVTQKTDEYLKIIIKDYKQGTTVFFDIHCFAFVPNCHLTPQAITNLDNCWKIVLPISNFSFLYIPNPKQSTLEQRNIQNGHYFSHDPLSKP